MLVKPGICVNQSKLQGTANGPMENAAGEAKQRKPSGGEPPPPPDHLPLGLTQPRWGGGVEGAGSNRVSSTEVLTESRCGNSAKLLKLGKTGFAKNLADANRLTANRRYSGTGQPLQRLLKQPSVPLSGILYVEGSGPARSRSASYATVKGHSSVWLLGSLDSI